RRGHRQDPSGFPPGHAHAFGSCGPVVVAVRGIRAVDGMAVRPGWRSVAGRPGICLGGRALVAAVALVERAGAAYRWALGVDPGLGGRAGGMAGHTAACPLARMAQTAGLPRAGSAALHRAGVGAEVVQPGRLPMGPGALRRYPGLPRAAGDACRHAGTLLSRWPCQCRICMGGAVLLLRRGEEDVARPGPGDRHRPGPGVRYRPAAAWRALPVARPVQRDDLLVRGAGPVAADAASAQRRRCRMSSVAWPAPACPPRQEGRVRRWRPTVTVEALAMLASGYFALACNLSFWQAALPHGWQQWRLALALSVLLVCSHGLLLGLMLARPWARAMLMALLLVTGLATHYMQSYGVYLDPDMLRNVLHTDWAESRELLTPGLGLHLLLYAGLPVLLLSRVTVVRRPMKHALMVRAGFLLLMWCAMMVAAALSFRDVSA